MPTRATAHLSIDCLLVTLAAALKERVVCCHRGVVFVFVVFVVIVVIVVIVRCELALRLSRRASGLPQHLGSRGRRLAHRSS